ncbi:MAG: hypothetical protein IKJ11_10735 [Clostridia bacterium]|nr:hypothetical protein [Clostridia bacterium]
MRRVALAVFLVLLALLTPVCACALQIGMTEIRDEPSASTLMLFSAEADAVQITPGKQTQPDAVQMAVTAKIEERFGQMKAITAMNRGSVRQTGSIWQDGKTASMALVWQGEQADGTEGCMAAGLTVNLETGDEITMEQLFADYDGALAQMERIIADDVLGSMSDYMEYADLLPMPQDNYAVNERGLTVYWPQDRYRYFDGMSGSVTFYWYELADYIGAESPVYALARTDAPNNLSAIEAQCMSGGIDPMLALELGELLGNAAQWYPLADPDYTTDALVFPLERERGFAVEIPKYAETDEDDTPISAIRAARISMGGLLTTGKTTQAEAIALFSEPARETTYSEAAAFDAMLVPGKSLFYEVSGRVLQLHFDGDDLLSCVILHDAMPGGLYGKSEI